MQDVQNIPDPKNLSESIKEFKNIFTPENNKFLQSVAMSFANAAERMNSYANQFNVVFGQGRQRMNELMVAVADATPNVVRLGGDIKDATQTITEVAEASRRSVIANAEQVEGLFAASEILKKGVKSISDSFLNVGMSIEQIPETIEESMKYVSSIGGNAKQVIGDVLTSMEQMNRFNFENGVMGITKMAAQASMLRFDMKSTFEFADKVMDPEGAIEMTNQFQRLGMSIGSLGDPFQLMNQSLNDPSGLQDSIIEATKKFTYFDEKTKSFKISREGMLTFRELGKTIGYSADELSKMALSSADLNARLSEINRAGLKLASEEDKQYLANIANLEGGKYMVTLEDNTKKELSELTQPEFEKLIEQQRNAPKTLEDIARNQYNSIQTMGFDLRAIRDKVVYGLVSARPVRENLEGLDNVIRNIFGEVSRTGSTAFVRGRAEEGFEKLTKTIEDFITNPPTNMADAMKKIQEELKPFYNDIKNDLTSGAKSALSAIMNKSTSKSSVERFVYKELGDFKRQLGITDEDRSFGGRSMSSLVSGRGSANTMNAQRNSELLSEGIVNYLASLSQEERTKLLPQLKSGNISQELITLTQNPSLQKVSDVNVGGNITVKLTLPDNFNQIDKDNLTKMLEEVFKSKDFQTKIKEISRSGNPTSVARPGR